MEKERIKSVLKQIGIYIYLIPSGFTLAMYIFWIYSKVNETGDWMQDIGYSIWGIIFILIFGTPIIAIGLYAIYRLIRIHKTHLIIFKVITMALTFVAAGLIISIIN